MTSLLPNAKQQFFDADGQPLALGTVAFYIPTTTTPKTTWQDASQSVPNTNPVQLDASGEALIYGQGQYRQIVYDAMGNLIWDELTNSYNTGDDPFVVAVADPSLPNARVLEAGPLLELVDAGAGSTLTVQSDGTGITTLAVAAGTNNITLTPGVSYPEIDAYFTGLRLAFVAVGTSNGAVTIQVGAIGFKNAYLETGVAAGSGDVGNTNYYEVAYNAALNSGAGGWVILGTLSSSGGGTAGNTAGPVGAVANLTGAVTGDATVTRQADSVVVGAAGGASFTIGTPSVVINGAVNGANGLDTGALAASTWYATFIISQGAAGATAGLLSLSRTAPTLPGGYTYLAFVGWVITDGAGHFYRTIIKGARSQYVVTGGTNTAALRQMSTGLQGNVNVAPTWVAVPIGAYVPPTAGAILGTIGSNAGGNAYMAAPNNSYSGFQSASNAPPINVAVGNSWSEQFQFLLESTNIYWASSNPNAWIAVFGWIDNAIQAAGAGGAQSGDQPNTAVNLGAAVSGSTNIDLALGNYFYGTVTGNTTFAMVNQLTAPFVNAFTMEITNGGAHTLSWPAGMKWPGGSPPAFTASGTDILVFTSRDNGVVWRGAMAEADSS